MSDAKRVEMSSSDPSHLSPGLTESQVRPLGRIRWWIHLILIGGYFIPPMFAQMRTHPMLTHTTHGLLIVCAFQMGLFGLLFGLGWWCSGASREQMLLSWRPGWWVVPLGVGYSVAIRLGIMIIAFAISAILLATVFDQRELVEFWRAGEPNIKQIVSVTAARSNPVYAWLLITLVSFVVAGLREELWRAGTLAAMRSLWPRAFGTRRGEVLAIGVLAIAFGAGHLRLGIVAAVVAGVLGIFLGLTMVTHRSVWPAVIAHGAFDATTFALLAWLPSRFHQF